jgi:hypothetical protein
MLRYRVNGLFINRWDDSRHVLLQHCVANFKSVTGFDLPRSASEQSRLPVRISCGGRSGSSAWSMYDWVCAKMPDVIWS